MLLKFRKIRKIRARPTSPPAEGGGSSRCPARVVGRSPPGDYFPYPVRGLDEHSLFKREAVWSSLEILLPWVSGVPGVGWKMVIFACFSGFFPPKTRVTRSYTTSPRRGDVPSFQRPRCFPLRARSKRCLWGGRGRRGRSRGHFD